MPFGPFKKITKPITSAIKGVSDLVGDVTGLFGSSGKELAAGTLSYKGGAKARELSIAQALKQMQFQDASSARQFERTKELAKTAYDRSAYLSNTAWQRGMADMRLAGLNPILAYKQGPASTPSIQMGSVGLQSGAMAPIQDIITPAIQTAQNVKATGAQVKKANAEANLALQRAKESISKIGLNQSQEQFYKDQATKILQETLNLEQVYKLNELGITDKELDLIIKDQVARNASTTGFSNISQAASAIARKVADGYREIAKLFGLDVLVPMEGRPKPKYPLLRIEK